MKEPVPVHNSVSSRLALNSQRLPVSGWALLLLVSSLLYGFHLGRARALTEHEIVVAGIARQMVMEGDWLVPRIGDRVWLEKPPLPYWLAALCSVGLGGFTESSVRLPSVLSGLGVVLLVAGLATRWFGAAIGLLAGLVQCTTVYMVTYSRLSEENMPLALLVTAAISVFVRLQGIGGEDLSERGRRWAAVLFWSLVGLTNLLKGLLFGAAIILGPCAVWLLLRRDRVAWRRAFSPLGIVLAIGLVVVWPIAILSREPAALDLLNAEIRRRLSGTFTGNPWWYYLTTPLWQLLPWTPFLFAGAAPSFARAFRDRDAPDRFLLCWALVPAIMLSLVPGKHHHYLIHCLPAVSPLIAIGLFRFVRWACRRAASSPWRAFFGIAVGAALFAVAPAILGRSYSFWRAEAWLLGVLLGVGILTAGVLVLAGRPGGSIAVLIAAAVVMTLFVHARVLPRRDPSREDRIFLSSVHRFLPPRARLIATGGNEIARHIFYVQAPLEAVGEPARIGPRIRDSKPVFVITRARSMPALQCLGSVTRIAQSPRSRYEKNPEDRFTLFRLVPSRRHLAKAG